MMSHASHAGRLSLAARARGVWASLNFHEFVSNSQPLGFTGVTGKPVTPKQGEEAPQGAIKEEVSLP